MGWILRTGYYLCEVSTMVQIPDLNHNEHLWDLLDKVRSMNAPQLTWLQGSAANVWVPVTTANLQRCPCLSGSELVWQHKGDLHDIRQVVFMLADWCIWLSALLFPSAGKSPTAQDVKLVGWRARMHTVINDILSSVTPTSVDIKGNHNPEPLGVISGV